MSHACSRLAAVIVLLAAIFWSTSAAAGSYFLCDGPGGSIAITQTKHGYSNCKQRSYPDPVHTAPAEGSKAAEAAWKYRDQTGDKPIAIKTVDERPAPAPVKRIDVRARNFGVVSTARLMPTPQPPVAPAPAPVRDAAGAVPALLSASIDKPEIIKPGAAPKPRVVRGAVYRVARGNGITEYTNVKPLAAVFDVLFTYIATCAACDVHSTVDWLRTPLRLDAYRNEIASAAMDTGVDASLLRAVIHAESAFNPFAVSIKGAQGLMQLMPGTASDLGVSDAFDVGQNIEAGARYLKQLLSTFNGNEEFATAAYNAGPGAVRKYGGIPPYDETKVYVQRVAALHDRYRKAL